MLRVKVELVPQGVETVALEIARATIGNIGGTPLHADYRYRLWSPPSHYAPGFSREGVVSAHDRWQTAWALVRAVLEDWWTTDGWNGGFAEEPGKPRLRAVLESDGTILEISHGPWRVIRVGGNDWLLLRGAEERMRWSDLAVDAAREKLLEVLVQETE
jgi:hypothetical protein